MNQTTGGPITIPAWSTFSASGSHRRLVGAEHTIDLETELILAAEVLRHREGADVWTEPVGSYLV